MLQLCQSHYLQIILLYFEQNLMNEQRILFLIANHNLFESIASFSPLGLVSLEHFDSLFIFNLLNISKLAVIYRILGASWACYWKKLIYSRHLNSCDLSNFNKLQCRLHLLNSLYYVT